MNICFSGGPVSGVFEPNARVKHHKKGTVYKLDLYGKSYTYKMTGKKAHYRGMVWFEFVFEDE